MPLRFLFPLFLQLAGPLAFLNAAGLAGILNRSLLLVPLLALTATGLSWLMQRWGLAFGSAVIALFGKPANARPGPSMRGLIASFVGRWLGYGVVFLGAAMFAALFQVTEFEPRLQPTDLWFLAAPVLIALPAQFLAHHLGLGQAQSFMQAMQQRYTHHTSGPDAPSASETPFTVEGEVIERSVDET